MSTLFIMCGLPFSGKTTLSKKISELLNITRVSFDEVWLMTEKQLGHVPGINGTEQWKFVCHKCEEIIKNELHTGQSVVYDNLGDNIYNRRQMKNLASKSNSLFKIIYINVDKETAIERRNKNFITKQRSLVTDENFNKALNTFQPPKKTENFCVYRPDQNEKQWIIDNLMEHVS